MITCTPLNHATTIQQLRVEYLRTLTAPIDGMWESTAISSAMYQEIQDQGQRIGYFCLDSNHCLLRFYLFPDYQAQAQTIFRWILSTYELQYAITSTIEPLYLALCLDVQTRIALHSYLFRDHMPIQLPSVVNALPRQATIDAFSEISAFYHANIAGPGDWIDAFVRERLDHGELFVLYDQQSVVATGECIPSQYQKPYADLGIVVAQSYRGRGLGSFLLTHLKTYCYTTGWKPICSCAADNHASRRAIEKAGFISDQRMLQVSLTKEHSL